MQNPKPKDRARSAAHAHRAAHQKPEHPLPEGPPGNTPVRQQIREAEQKNLTRKDHQ